jgi:MFS family permease
VSAQAEPAAADPASPATEAPFPRAALAWGAVAILLVLSVLAYLDRQIVSLMVGMIKAEFGVSDSRMGLLQGAAFSLVYSIAALPFGYAVDRYSRRWTIFAGVFCWAIAATACGLATSFSTLLAARIGVGLGEAALNPAVASILGDLFPKKRLSTAFAVVSVGSNIGSAGALIIGGAVLHWAGDGMSVPVLGYLASWKIAFIVTGLPGLLLAFSIFLMAEPKRHGAASHAQTGGTWSDVFAFIGGHRRFFGLYIGASACLSIAGYGTISWVPTVFQRSNGWSAGDTGMIYGTYVVACGLVGTLMAGIVADRIYGSGRRDAHALYYLVGSILTVIFGGLTAFSSSAFVYLALLAPVKLFANFSGVALAGLQTVTPAQFRGRIAAIFSLVIVCIGATVGPSAVAFFTDVVFADEAKLKWSVAATLVIFGALGASMLAAARGPMIRLAATA